MPTRDDDRQDNRLQDAINDLKNIFRTIMDILTKMDLDEITYVTKETFSLEISLYYQDAEGEWRQVKSVTPRDMKYLKETAVKELFEKKKISYDIDAPKEEKSEEHSSSIE